MKRYTPIVGLLLVYAILLSLSCGSAVAQLAEVQDQPAVDEAEDATFTRTPSGWINWVSPDAIIINDTRYVFTGQTRYLDGKNILKVGSFVEFRIQEDNILSQISLAEPREKDMYMKPETETSSAPRQESASQDESQSPGSEDTDTQDGGMRLENGVWVN